MKSIDEIQAGPFEELKQPNLIRAFNLAKGKEFEVNVVATMSAGKSTLINALTRSRTDAGKTGSLHCDNYKDKR